MQKEQIEKLLNVASDTEMTPNVLKSLYNVTDIDTVDAEIRLTLSLNTSTPSELLDKLIRDNDENVRVNVARHQNISQKALSIAVKDKSLDVRLAALDNVLISEDDLWTLTRDGNTDVSTKARSTLKRRL